MLRLSSVPTKDPAVEETAAVSLITPHDFHTVRSYLEQFEDVPLLADVVNIVTSSLDPSVLASATDTMHYHLKAFRAIGALRGRLNIGFGHRSRVTRSSHRLER